MTKHEIADEIAIKCNLTKREVLNVIDNFLEKITKTVDSGDRIEIRGFGTFYQLERKSKKVYSPIAQKTLTVEAKKVLGFKASKMIEKNIPGA